MKNVCKSDKVIEKQNYKSHKGFVEHLEKNVVSVNEYKNNQKLIKNLIYQNSTLIDQQKILQKENSDLKEKILFMNSQKSEEINNLKVQLLEITNAYNDIKKSHFWRITLPFQRLIDLFHKKRETKEILNTSEKNSKIK